ncbi:hypothetical protein RhiXN_10160 [Rhizoctonia solani]|uniref:Uncharacterized protein n=1 Tax=Rhizoctonia solani TaxID=456999 RepID=A0A8H8P158_9AGAM|nr:uncharacterized protein RhiXN_10160 [Rhizoctonia solani]QRW23836.1 hypothetical protein RhiXN_10160 [Rhizoctonia solani]
MSYPDYRLVYFLTDQELVDTYKVCGGTLGNFNVNSFDDTEHARRFLFHYLCPSPIRHWYASLDGEPGVAFMVGKTARNIRKSMKRDLQQKCKDLFKRSPNYCLPAPGLMGSRSDRVGDMYPYRPKDSEPSVAQFPDVIPIANTPDLAPIKRPFPDYRLVYFLTDQELVDTHKVCGGTLGNFNVNSFDDTEHARRFLFHYLCPSPIRTDGSQYSQVDETGLATEVQGPVQTKPELLFASTWPDGIQVGDVF